jgi:hypothetical protein
VRRGRRRQYRIWPQVELRAADADQRALVELQQRRLVPAHGGLTGDEHPVVGLDLVAHMQTLSLSPWLTWTWSIRGAANDRKLKSELLT